MITLLTRLILILILAFVLFRIIRYLFSPRTAPGMQNVPGTGKKAINEMVQDPQCGVYVSKKEAYANRVGNEVFYFCSEECCQKYLQKK